MKKYIIRLTLFIVCITSLVSCNDDFLERTPLDALSESSYFKSANDLKTYANNFYDQLPRYRYNSGPTVVDNVHLDGNSDVLIFAFDITPNLDQIGSSGLAPLSSSVWNGTFNRIRNVNYFLANYDKVNTRDAVANQFIGEGYFFRAWNYFNFMVNYGDVPYITEPLNTDSEELYRPRDSRYEVAKGIIQDLDSAIVNLSWKGVGEAKAGRINKEAAMVMKARVALYEGSWEYYHAAAGTKFAVTGHDGKDLLQLVEPTIQELIAHQGGKIFKSGGPYNEPYNQLFSQTNGESTDGVFMYRVYDASLLSVSHNFWGKVNDYGFSITKRMIDMYLDKDGVPQAISDKALDLLNEKGQNLDPRFRQTIWTPDRGPMDAIPGRSAQGSQSLRYPIPTQAIGTAEFTATGYRNWKGAIFNNSEYRAGETDDILIRYAEGLLALAEAKAILGTINQADIDKTVNVLRGRVGMAPMSLSEVNSWTISYSSFEGFDPTAPNILNEIRRERTIELALDGFRLDDLKRWAVFDKAINGYKPKGALIQEFVDYFNDPVALANDGWTNSVDLTLKPGINIQADDEGYINPFFRSTQFLPGGQGFYVDKNRDYLSPVPTGEIDLYEQSEVTLTQNPGWQ